jgi:hypothetical protein
MHREDEQAFLTLLIYARCSAMSLDQHAAQPAPRLVSAIMPLYSDINLTSKAARPESPKINRSGPVLALAQSKLG